MFVTDFKCLHDFFYACMLTSVSPITFLIMYPWNLAPFFLVAIEPAITSWESKNCKGKGSRKGVVVRALEPGSNSAVDTICGWVVFGSFLCPKRFFSKYPDFPLPSRTEKKNKTHGSGRRRTTVCWCATSTSLFIRHFLLFMLDNQVRCEIFRPHDHHCN